MSNCRRHHLDGEEFEAAGRGLHVRDRRLSSAADRRGRAEGRDRRYRLPIKVVVLNNGGIGSGIAEFPKDAPLPPRVLTIGARYHRMMEAFGGKGWYVEDPRDRRGALDRAMEFDGPALVNVKLHHA